jgi:hypothetical protein
MKNIIRICLLVFCIISFTSCKKNIKADIKTNLTGLVNDPIANLPISNSTIYVEEYKSGFYGPVFNRVIDSTKSGSDGRYTLAFVTTGKGVEYRLACSTGFNYYSQQGAQDISIGTDNSINFWAYKLHVLKARILVSNNPNPPLRVYGTISLAVGNISSTSNDTTIFLPVIPNFENYIYFTIRNIDTPAIYNARIDTLRLQGLTDTFTHTFQVDPTLFRRRL